jgi:hypothetical protein
VGATATAIVATIADAVARLASRRLVVDIMN